MDESDRERLGLFFELHHQPLFRFALRITADREEALDLLQEAMLRGSRAMRRVPADDAAALSWMYRVIVNLARDRYRRLKVRAFFAPMLASREQAADPRDTLVTRSAVHSALATLPPRQRAVIALCELEELTVADAARVLGISSITVRWHLAQARKRLAILLGVRS